jgi:hypothetical protein
MKHRGIECQNSALTRRWRRHWIITSGRKPLMIVALRACVRHSDRLSTRVCPRLRSDNDRPSDDILKVVRIWPWSNGNEESTIAASISTGRYRAKSNGVEIVEKRRRRQWSSAVIASGISRNEMNWSVDPESRLNVRNIIVITIAPCEKTW